MTLRDLVNDVTIQAEIIKIINVNIQDGLELTPSYYCSGELTSIPDDLGDMEVLYIYPENGNVLNIEVTEVFKP